MGWLNVQQSHTAHLVIGLWDLNPGSLFPENCYLNATKHIASHIATSYLTSLHINGHSSPLL